MSILFITIYYVPLYYQFVRGESTVRSAVDLLPFLFTSVFAMLASGRLISGFGWYKFWFVSGSSLALVMSACLYNTELDTPRGRIYAYLVLGGIGIGLYAMNSAPVMAAIVAKEHTADASTVFGCIDTISGAISVAIANCIFVNRAIDNIQRLLPDTPRAMVQDTITGVGASLSDQHSPSDRMAVLQATLDAIKDVWIQMIATAALSLVLSFFMRNKNLSDVSRLGGNPPLYSQEVVASHMIDRTCAVLSTASSSKDKGRIGFQIIAPYRTRLLQYLPRYNRERRDPSGA
ncbi:MAG: hypothetical protein LQ346_008554 [Caloplaca aetnensis]|nr:MAG: hypothetical protein LQ346_008554 [Caloplaca aetnensis]